MPISTRRPDALLDSRALQASMAVAVAIAWMASGTASTKAFIDSLCTDAKPMFASAAADRSAGRPTTSIRPISCEKLADVPGKSVTTVVVSFPPGAYSPAHRHPGSVTAFVLKGTVRSQMAGSPAQAYAMGTSWFEPARALHLFAENPSSSEPAELLATFVTDSDCGPLVIPEPNP